MQQLNESWVTHHWIQKYNLPIKKHHSNIDEDMVAKAQKDSKYCHHNK